MHALFKVLFLLIYFCHTSSLALSCKDVLKPDFSKNPISLIKRNSTQITDEEMSKKILIDLGEDGHIIARSNNPNSRTQCYGTCYAYASVSVVENELKIEGLMPRGAIITAPEVLMYVAQNRVQSGSPVTNFKSLLHGGSQDVLHVYHGREISFLNSPNIRKFGSRDQYMDEELFFLKKSLDTLSQRAHLTQIDFTDTNLASNFNSVFIDHLNDDLEGNNSLRIQASTLGRLSFQYEYYALVNTNVGVELHHKSINTNKFKATGQAYDALIYEPDTVSKLPTGKYDEETIRKIVKQMSRDKFIWVILKKGVFGEAHAVTLTNLVINKRTRNIMGFVFLDSNHRASGYYGYRFISAQELMENMTHFSYISSISLY